MAKTNLAPSTFLVRANAVPEALSARSFPIAPTPVSRVKLEQYFAVIPDPVVSRICVHASPNHADMVLARDVGCHAQIMPAFSSFCKVCCATRYPSASQTKQQTYVHFMAHPWCVLCVVAYASI